MMRSFLVLAIVLGSYGGAAQARVQDTTAASIDTSSVADSLRITFIPAMGKVSEQPDSGEFSVGQFLWTDAFAAGDMFRARPEIFVRDMGSPGLPLYLSFGGSDWRGVSWLLDGRPLSDPVTGILNLYDIPLEFIDHLELLRGPSSFVFGPQASAASINVVSRQYNTGRPITKIRFMQGPDEHLLTDALYTQNIVRPLNIMIGLQRHTSDERFVNSRYDSWNVRSRLRFNISDRFNLSLTDLYRRSTTGMNNGIDLDSTRSLNLEIFNDAEAVVRSREASETTSRRDVTLAAVARIAGDSLSLSHASLYYSTAERVYNDPGSMTSGDFDSFDWNVAGGSVRQVLEAGFARATLGGIYERQHAAPGSRFARSEKTMSAWYGDALLRLGTFSPSVFWRGERNGLGQAFSYGLGITAVFDGLRVSGGFSEAHRFPSLQELSWPTYLIQGSGPADLKERHRLIEVSAVFVPLAALEFSAGALQRSIANALSFVPLQQNAKFPDLGVQISPEVTIRQVFGTVTLRIWHLEGRGGFMITESKKGASVSTIHPELIATGELSYRDRFFNDALDARFVLQSRYVSRHQGVRFVPSATVFAENSGNPIGSFSTVDLFGVFKIGDAFVTLTWQNPLDRQFFTVYGYPALGRNVRVGLNWIFLD